MAAKVQQKKAQANTRKRRERKNIERGVAGLVAKIKEKKKAKRAK